jgi:hypothetical protein
LAISNQTTRLGYVVDVLQELIKISINQIYISYASHRDSLPLVRTTYDVKALIRMEYERQVIIKFLFNNGLDPRQVVKKLEIQLHEDDYSLRTVQFWIAEVRRRREDLHDEPPAWTAVGRAYHSQNSGTMRSKSI